MPYDDMNDAQDSRSQGNMKIAAPQK